MGELDKFDATNLFITSRFGARMSTWSGEIAMAPMAAGTGSGPMDQRQFLSELNNIQKSMFDQTSNYTKLVFGFGVCGLFWSIGRHEVELTTC